MLDWALAYFLSLVVRETQNNLDLCSSMNFIYKKFGVEPGLKEFFILGLNIAQSLIPYFWVSYRPNQVARIGK